MLQLEELQLIMEEALRENGLRLPANDVQDLAFALYEEALGPDDADNGEISIDQLKARLEITLCTQRCVYRQKVRKLSCAMS